MEKRTTRNIESSAGCIDFNLQRGYSVFVSGDDVYAAGSSGLWKNGVQVFNEFLNDVCVYDNNMYAVSDDGLWINGIKQSWGAGNSIVVK